MSTERWAPYHGYQVSDKGCVLNKHGRELHTYRNKENTPFVSLYLAGKRTSRSINSLVEVLFNAQQDAEDERWADYHGYKVSNKGRVLNKHGREMRPQLRGETSHEYVAIYLRIDGQRVIRRLAHVVWELFNTSTIWKGEQYHIYYLDECPRNCAFENLLICKAYTEERTPEQISKYEEAVVPCVKHFFSASGYFDRGRQGLDVNNALGEAYRLIYKHLAQYRPKTSFYCFCKRYARIAFSAELRRFKEQRKLVRALKEQYREEVMP